MAQDEIGFLWLGTQGGGLARFDGVEFEVFTQKNGLISNYIHSLHVQNDSLYVGSRNGLSVKIKNRFVNFEAPQIRQIYSFDNRIYLATEEGIYLLTHDGQLLLHRLEIHPDIDASKVNSISFDGQWYWVATNTGLWKLGGLSQSANITQWEHNNFTSVIVHGPHILAATFDDGIFVIERNNHQEAFLLPEPIRINSLSIQDEDELWIATESEGVVIVETAKFTEIKKLNTTNGLTVPDVRMVVEDRRSNSWIATSGGGFYKYFNNNFTHYDRTKGLKGNRIYAVHQAKDGLWISSSENGLSKIDSLGIHPMERIVDFADVKIKTITSDDQGNIWAGSDNRGILFRETKLIDSLAIRSIDAFQIRIDTLVKRVIKNHVFNEDNGFPSDWIRKVVVADDAIWAATYSKGIVKFNYLPERDSLLIHQQFGAKDGLQELLMNDLAIDPTGKIWYATENGYLGYIQNDTVIPVNTQLEGQTAIGSLLFHESDLFIGTLGKGVWYAEDSAPDTLRPVMGIKNISSSNVYQLIIDDQGSLWVGTEKGVDRIELNPSAEIVALQHFAKNDGFLSGETYLNALDKDKQGNLWFGGMYGLTRYAPDKAQNTKVKPKVYFMGIEEAYSPIDSLVLQDWTNSERMLPLNPQQTQLGFTFRTVDLNHPNEVEYRTKLDAADWSPWAKEDKQNFAGLAYGPHTFSVQSRNHGWTTSDPISFRFYIDRPLYQKDGFKWAVLIGTILGLIALGLGYIKRLKAKNKATQQQLQTQNYLLTLEQKALQLQMNPHFIFNVLNGIKAMAGSQPEKMNATINGFATLLRETLHNSRKEYISLAQEINTLSHYVEIEKLMASKSFHCSIEVDTDPDPEEILIPPMLVQPFVENAIRHGILKGVREGKLDIGFRTTKTHVQCRIRDNGIGIYSSQKEKTPTDHQSMALTVTKERLASIPGSNPLRITEIKTEEGTISGTEVIFEIPLITDY